MKIESIIEAALFCEAEPLTKRRLMQLFSSEDEVTVEQIDEALEHLKDHYAQRGVYLTELKSGFSFQTQLSCTPYIQRLHEKKPPKASPAYLETLAIIAYKQPVTRGEIEQIRGVAVSTSIIRSLLERQWVRVTGYRDVPGKPALYATTADFLDAFNLKSLKDLPPLKAPVGMDDSDQASPLQLDMLNGKEQSAFTRSDDFDQAGEVNPVVPQVVDNSQELDEAYQKAQALFDQCDEFIEQAMPQESEDGEADHIENDFQEVDDNIQKAVPETHE